MADVDMTDAPAPKAKATKAVAESSSDSKKRFEVKKVCSSKPRILHCALADGFQWNAVALWAWDIVVDNCAICRNHIMDLCKARWSLASSCSRLTFVQASNARRTKHLRRAKSVQWRGGFAM